MVPRVLPPIIRRLYPSLMIRDLVSVQPIPTPECKVFFKNTMLTGTATEVPNYTAAGRACATANSVFVFDHRRLRTTSRRSPSSSRLSRRHRW
jgi:hypothetical protein